MDQENQAQIKALSAKYPREEIVVVLGSGEPEMSALLAETVAMGDFSRIGPLAGVQLGLPAYHIVEDVIKTEVPPEVYAGHMAMMEMVLDVTGISRDVSAVRNQLNNNHRQEQRSKKP